MNDVQWRIPESMLEHLERVPRDRSVIVLLRHSVRDDLPPEDVGYEVSITDAGRRLAMELGTHLRGRLATLRSSPLPRCIETAGALANGACAAITVVPDRNLGDPGIFVLDGRRAWAHWQALGHEGVMRHLVSERTALAGMARPDEAARYLVHHMLSVAADRPGIHVFVTHDSLITGTAARLLGRTLDVRDWPTYLEGAFFWKEANGVVATYRDFQARCTTPLCSLDNTDVLEFARHEIAATVGLDSDARFFLAGGAFKSLLTGVPPRDLDLWAPSARDRTLLIDALRARGARPSNSRPFVDAFKLDGRLIEIPHNIDSTTLPQVLGNFDIGLSAVGVEHRPDGDWTVHIDPLALESVRRREVLLLKPLANWRYALATLERMRRYACELRFCNRPVVAS